MEPGLDEQFEIFDEQGKCLGQRARAQVHRLGLWHKSSHVFVFNVHGCLLIQQRAPDKDLYAGLWDYSVGEHLKPGEDYESAALRGLQEEMSISDVSVQALGAEQRVELRGADYLDREMQQAFRCDYTGQADDIVPDPIEVAACRFVSLADLQAWVDASPQQFTPWFVADMQRFGWLS